MLFNSAHFVLLFFPLVTVLYYVLGHSARLLLLFMASCYFYMAFVPRYILILFFLILFDYGAGLLIERSPLGGRRRWLYLLASLWANGAVLAVFKYWNFVNANVTAAAHALGWHYGVRSLSLLLPIGLSFHTFQSMSYTIEVYRGKQRAERNLGIYALYVMFYPQLVAGPIERPQNLIHQFHERKVLDYGRIVSGLQLMLWGFFKKCFVADRLALVVDPIYNHPAAHNGWSFPYLLATYCFAYQIYCDFSGYSDIARGAARVLGFDLMENFKYPFLARTVSEFWQRWHISLSTWFKDYLYMPLCCRALDRGDASPRRLYGYVVLVFLVSGFWHGAGWSFGLWGACHGLFIVCSSLFKPLRTAACRALGLGRWPRLLNALRILTTFHLVGFTWILFRADSLADAGLILRNLAIAPLDLGRALREYGHNGDLLVGLCGVGMVMVMEALERRRFGAGQWCCALLLVLLLLGAPLSERSFIYFQF